MKTKEFDLQEKQKKQNKFAKKTACISEEPMVSCYIQSNCRTDSKYIINVFRCGVRKSGTPTLTIKPVGRIHTSLPRVSGARLTANVAELGAIRRRAP